MYSNDYPSKCRTELLKRIIFQQKTSSSMVQLLSLKEQAVNQTWPSHRQVLCNWKHRNDTLAQLSLATLLDYTVVSCYYPGGTELIEEYYFFKTLAVHQPTIFLCKLLYVFVILIFHFYSYKKCKCWKLLPYELFVALFDATFF